MNLTLCGRDIQEQADIANVVFAVKVRLSNADHRLKAGMNADAVIETLEATR